MGLNISANLPVIATHKFLFPNIVSTKIYWLVDAFYVVQTHGDNDKALFFFF
jgi:hypothetical protein